MDIMMRLKGSGFSMIANEFREREKRLGGGLPLQDFVEIVLQGLPRAKSAEEKASNVNALVDLFDEIDINGDGVMEFDEFTSFCVDAGMVAMRVKAATLKHRYVRNPKHVIKTANGCVGIEKVKWCPHFKKLMAIENTAKTVKLFDLTGKFLAEVGGKSTLNVLPVTPRANESHGGESYENSGSGGTSRASSSRATARERGGGNPGPGTSTVNDKPGSSHASAGSTSSSAGSTVGIFILDAVFMFKYQWLALSTTDFVISFYDMNETRKSSILTVLPDSTTAAAKCGPSFELLKPLTITTTTAQLLLRFCESSGLLFSSGNDFVLNVWKIVDSETKVLWKRLVLHQDMVMDLIEVPQHDLIVSCDLHRSIQLWDIHDCRTRGALVGHTHGVKQLVYSSHHDMLLSAGFEFDAYGWDIASRQVVMRLSGHRAPLVGVQIALFQTERAVTADCMGVFKVWDISRNTGGGGLGASAPGPSTSRGHGTASQAIQLESIDPSQHFSRFEPTAFICMHPHSRDLWTATAGSATLHRFRSTRVQQLDEIPLRAFYHYNANKFIVVAGPVCSIWDGESGTCLEEFTHVGNIGGGGGNGSTGKKANDIGGTASTGASSNGTAAGPSSGYSSNTVHNGSGSSTSSEPCVEVLACVQDQNCKKLVVVTEKGELGVFNALNFVQMRKCQEVFYGGQSSDSSTSNPTTSNPTTPGTLGPTKNPSCGIVGLHYCSVNKLIIAADADESAILVIDDNTNHDSTRGMKDTTVLRRLTNIPGGISASAYGFHVCLVATISNLNDESGDRSVSLWDFETLTFVANCEFQRETTDHEGHALHVLEFWDEFPVLLAADTLGGIYFYAAMPLINCNTGKLLHSFANDHEYASPPMGIGGGQSRAHKHMNGAIGAAAGIAEAENENEGDERQESDTDNGQREQPQDKTAFLTETTELAAQKLLKWRKKSVGTKENASSSSTTRAGAGAGAGDAPQQQNNKLEVAPLGCVVTCMKIVFDDANARYLLFTGDESGVVRVWDLTKMIERLSLSKIPEIKCKFLRRGYHPKAMFTRDYLKDATSEENSGNNRKGFGGHHHQPVLAHGGGGNGGTDWRAALLTNDENDPHFQLSQTDMKRLSRRRLDSKKRSTAVVVPSSTMSKQQAAVRTVQQANTATVAFAAAEAFLGAPKKGSKAGGGGKTVGFSLSPASSSSSSSKKRSSLLSLSAASSRPPQRRQHSAHRQFDDIQIVHFWKAHSDGLTSIEVTKNPDILVTCSLDMRVFNIGRWKWQFKKDDSKRQAERDLLVRNLIRDLEMTPLEKAHKRRQTLYQEHTARKSLKDMQRVNTILLDHIISKNPELDLLKTAAIHEDEDDTTRSHSGRGDTDDPALLADNPFVDAGEHLKKDRPKVNILVTGAQRQSHASARPETTRTLTTNQGGPQQPKQLPSSSSPVQEPERVVKHSRLRSLAQVGPLLCVNKFEYKNQTLIATGKAEFAEQDDQKMDKKYLEQELSISFPTSLSSIPLGGSDTKSMSNNLSDVQSQIQVAHLAAKAAFESRTTLERKTAEMYVNLERVKYKAKRTPLLQSQFQQKILSERAAQDADLEFLEPSEFLKKHIPASKLSIRPQTAPSVQKRLQQIKKLPLANQSSNGGGHRQTHSTASLPPRQSAGGGRGSSSNNNQSLLNSSTSTPLLAYPNHQRQSVEFDRRKSSMDTGFIDEVKRHTKHNRTAVAVASSSLGGITRRSSALGWTSSISSGGTLGDPSHTVCVVGDNTGDDGVDLSLRKLRAINQILSKAQQYCSPAKETSMSTNRPSTAPFSRASASSNPNTIPLLTPPLHTGDDADENEDECGDAFDSDLPARAVTSDAAVREHLEETKRKMASAMRDGERSPHRSDLQKIRQSVQQQQKARRMEDYLQQKRREMNTNIGNVFKRTSFAFQSKATDDPMAILAANSNSTSTTTAGARQPVQFSSKTKTSPKAKLELEKSATVFGIYGVREVMSVIRLFWSMDEDGSGNISLEELLQYKHFFEKLGYNDMATVFQAIDKDGNGHVSLKELLEICFHYATKYQIEEMLKLAKVGNVRTYLQGGEASSGSGTNGKDPTALSQEHRRELLDIFRVFDKNGDGGVSMQELMEALRVDDDNVIAKVMAEQASRKSHRPGGGWDASWDASWDATPSGITKEDVERLYRDFDANRNATLDFDEFVALMRTLYGPKSNVYFR